MLRRIIHCVELCFQHIHNVSDLKTSIPIGIIEIIARMLVVLKMQELIEQQESSSCHKLSKEGNVVQSISGPVHPNSWFVYKTHKDTNSQKSSNLFRICIFPSMHNRVRVLDLDLLFPKTDGHTCLFYQRFFCITASVKYKLKSQ